MRSNLLVIGAILISLFYCNEANAQKFRNSYYDNLRAKHEKEVVEPNSIIFLGNSITERADWQMLLNREDIVNRGIGGDNTYGIIDRLPCILKTQPCKVFLMAGINDLTANYSVATIVENISEIVDEINKTSPNCEVYIQSTLPTNDNILTYEAVKGKNGFVKELNKLLKKVCRKRSWCTYIDIASQMYDKNDELQAEFTVDGIHLSAKGYAIWVEKLNKLQYLD